MASTPHQTEDEKKAAQIAAAAQKLPVLPSRAAIVPPGKLPVSEFAADRSGAASPFGDDVPLPLPIERLTYTHPTEDAAPQHL